MSQIINMTDVLDRLDGDMEIFRATCSAFIEVVPDIIAELRTDLTNGHFSLIARNAHGLKGASANISAEIFLDLTKELETQSKIQDNHTCDEILTNLENHYTKLAAYLAENDYLEDDL